MRNPPAELRRAAATATVIAFLLTAPLPALAQAEPTPSIVIVEVLGDPDTTQGQREFVELWNTGVTTIDLAGWKLRDQPTTSGATNTFTFGTWNIPANGRVVVWGGGAADAKGPAWGNSAVWNNAGDGVTLLDTASTPVDWVGYGTATAPAGFADRTVLPAAPRGSSLQLRSDGWITGSPTPGTAYGAVGGGLGVEVTNAAPTAAFDGAPVSARPGARVALQFTLADANGAADVASWTLSSGAATLATGTTAGTQTATVTAPSAEGTWPLTLTVTDAAGASATAAAMVAVRASDLAVDIPGSLTFGAAAPGSTDTMTAAPVVVRNLGGAPIAPLLDVSPFVSAAGGSFPAEGHVWIRVGGGDWVAYEQALQALPAIAPNDSLELTFQLRGLPAGLAAGGYGASFSVVAP